MFLVLAGCVRETVLNVEALVTTLSNSSSSKVLLTVESNKPWIASSSASWLTVSPSSGEAGTFNISCECTENTDVNDRTATITVTSEDRVDNTEITQNGTGLETSLSDITVASSAGSSTTLTIEAAEAWSLTASDTKQSVSWLEISPSSGQAGTCEVTVKATEDNPDYDERNAYITFTVGEKSSVVTVTQKQKDAIILQKDRIEMGSDGGDFTVALQYDVDYEVTIPEGSSEWISRVGSKGLAASEESFSVAPGTEDGNRSGIVVFSDAAGGVSDTLFVYQSQVDKLILDPADTVGADGGTVEINVKSNMEYTAQLVDSPSWLKIADTKAVRADKIYLQADPNDTYGERSAVLKVTAESSGYGTEGLEVSDEIVVTQLQNDAIQLSVKEVDVPQAGDTFEIEVRSNVDYTCEVAGGVKWLHPLDAKSLIAGTFQFEAYENTGYDGREALIIFKSSGSDPISDTVNVVQDGIKMLSIDPHRVELTYEGGLVNVKITSNVGYEMRIAEGSDWLQEVDSKGLADDDYSFLAGSNPDYDSRVAKVVFLDDADGLYDTLTVIQGMNPYLSVTPKEITVGQEGGTFDAEVTSNFEYEVEIESGACWINEVKSKGLATGQHFFAVEANPLYKERAAYIFFNAADGSHSDTLRVNQIRLDDMETDSSRIYFTAAGGTAELKTLSNVGSSVSVGEGSDWLAVGETVAVSSLENGLTEYGTTVTATANTSVVAREAVLTVVSGDGSKQLTVGVVQTGEDVSLVVVSGNEINVGVAGCDTIVNLSCNDDYNVEIPADADWITVGDKVQDGFSYAQSLTVAGNSSVGQRSAEVVFRSVHDEDVSDTVTVTQDGEEAYLTLASSSSVSISSAGGNIYVKLLTNDGFIVGIPSSVNWITAAGRTGKDETYYQTLVVASDDSNSGRSAIVTFRSASNTQLTFTVTVSQSGPGTVIDNADGTVLQLQTHTAGNGIPMIIMGDGFDLSEIESGEFDTDADKAVDNFFSVEPYATYRYLFDVYRVEVVSSSSGISSSGSTTKLHTYIEDPGNSTAITTSDNCAAIKTYTQKVSGMDPDDGNLLVIVLMNTSTYAGTCWMWSNAYCVAMCPIIDNVTSSRFRQVLNHEAGGHGFGLLADEYYYVNNGTMPQYEISEEKQWQGYGFFQNVDFTSDENSVLWSRFLSDSRYDSENLGVYEGACTYPTGAYRSRNSSIMVNNTGGFNAPSRESIYKQIMGRAYSSWTYDYENFVSYDAINRSAATSFSSNTAALDNSGFVPFAPPHLIRSNP
jgi:hypothetical protein